MPPVVEPFMEGIYKIGGGLSKDTHKFPKFFKDPQKSSLKNSVFAAQNIFSTSLKLASLLVGMCRTLTA